MECDSSAIADLQKLGESSKESNSEILGLCPQLVDDGVVETSNGFLCNKRKTLGTESWGFQSFGTESWGFPKVSVLNHEVSNYTR